MAPGAFFRTIPPSAPYWIYWPIGSMGPIWERYFEYFLISLDRSSRQGRSPDQVSSCQQSACQEAGAADGGQTARDGLRQGRGLPLYCPGPAKRRIKEAVIKSAASAASLGFAGERPVPRRPHAGPSSWHSPTNLENVNNWNILGV